MVVVRDLVIFEALVYKTLTVGLANVPRGNARSAAWLHTEHVAALRAGKPLVPGFNILPELLQVIRNERSFARDFEWAEILKFPHARAPQGRYAYR